MNTSENGNLIADALSVLSDPVRFRIVLLVSEHGSLCANEILSYFDFTQPSLSYHLKALIEGSVLKSVKDGRKVYYSINSDVILRVASFFDSLVPASGKAEANDVKKKKKKKEKKKKNK